MPMLIRTGGGWYVRSKTTGRKLSKVFRNKRDAEQRMREIDYFKHVNKEGSKESIDELVVDRRDANADRLELVYVSDKDIEENAALADIEEDEPLVLPL